MYTSPSANVDTARASINPVEGVEVGGSRAGFFFRFNDSLKVTVSPEIMIIVQFNSNALIDRKYLTSAIA